jgi:hypothetical protein
MSDEPPARIPIDLPPAAGVAVRRLTALGGSALEFVFKEIKSRGGKARHRAKDEHPALELPGREASLKLLFSSGIAGGPGSPAARAAGEDFMRWYHAARQPLESAFPPGDGYIIEPVVLMAWEDMIDARG